MWFHELMAGKCRAFTRNNKQLVSNRQQIIFITVLLVTPRRVAISLRVNTPFIITLVTPRCIAISPWANTKLALIVKACKDIEFALPQDITRSQGYHETCTHSPAETLQVRSGLIRKNHSWRCHSHVRVLSWEREGITKYVRSCAHDNIIS